MKSSRRIKRMSRNRMGVVKMNLTSLMDVFTILVFFLLVNSASTEVLQTPKRISLPDSVVEEKPRETVVIFISPTEVTVQGESVIEVAEILKTNAQNIDVLGDQLQRVGENVIGLNTKLVAETQEVTILADKSVPFIVVKKVMSTCTNRGYGRISLAVLQKAPDAPEETEA
jgi:biopolymer transport protein ExbD